MGDFPMKKSKNNKMTTRRENVVNKLIIKLEEKKIRRKINIQRTASDDIGTRCIIDICIVYRVVPARTATEAI